MSNIPFYKFMWKSFSKFQYFSHHLLQLTDCTNDKEQSYFVKDIKISFKNAKDGTRNFDIKLITSNYMSAQDDKIIAFKRQIFNDYHSLKSSVVTQIHCITHKQLQSNHLWFFNKKVNFLLKQQDFIISSETLNNQNRYKVLFPTKH